MTGGPSPPRTDTRPPGDTPAAAFRVGTREDAAFRGSGDTRTPCLLLAGAVAVALALDPVLMH